MHGLPPFYSPSAESALLAWLPVIAIVVLWTLAIKGYALWQAARHGQKEWFVALLVINTLGILELVYLGWFRPTPSGTTPSTMQKTSCS